MILLNKLRLPQLNKAFNCGVETVLVRYKSSSASSKRWLNRQQNDYFTNKAKEDEYKSRAAYKLIDINAKFKIFKPGDTVVDLGFAPGSWSQVAHECTKPNGRVIGVDLLLAEPPVGVTAIQGNFLDPVTQLEVETLLANPKRGRFKGLDGGAQQPLEELDELSIQSSSESNNGAIEGIQSETNVDNDGSKSKSKSKSKLKSKRDQTSKADVVISDMCGIWPLTTGFWMNSINQSYRLANSSGIIARDHASSIVSIIATSNFLRSKVSTKPCRLLTIIQDLCDAALVFAIKNLRLNGSFLCKFYTGEEDADLEKRLKKVFKKVFRVKPKASRAASREAYLVGLKKKEVKDIAAVFE